MTKKRDKMSKMPPYPLSKQRIKEIGLKEFRIEYLNHKIILTHLF